MRKLKRVVVPGMETRRYVLGRKITPEEIAESHAKREAAADAEYKRRQAAVRRYDEEVAAYNAEHGEPEPDASDYEEPSGGDWEPGDNWSRYLDEPLDTGGDPN